MSPPRPSRELFVRNIRLRAVERAVSTTSGFCFGSDWSFEGDVETGRFYESNGQGDHVAAAGNAAGLVALAFDHCSPESEWSSEESDRDPARRFASPLPAELEALVEEAASLCARLATSALWIARDDASEHLPLDEADGMERLTEFTVPLLTESLARAIADATARGPAKLTADQVDEILGTKHRVADPKAHPPLDIAEVRLRVEALKAVGAIWERAEERARDVIAAHAKARSATRGGQPHGTVGPALRLS